MKSSLVEEEFVAVSAPALHKAPSTASCEPTFLEKLNTQWHKPALWIFAVIVIGHWAEHIFQAYQAYVMHWPMSKALGLLGLFYPWLVTSETLHYGYALVMLIGLWVLRKGFSGLSYKWWMAAFYIQFWHHIEHLVLLIQATTHHYWFHAMMPMSFVQALGVPRMPLHLFYNTIVTVPMVIGMYYHMFPRAGEEQHARCNCKWHAQQTQSAVAA